ncbi:hypothetical protein ERO13_D10G140300v2 [Gossypium hirsutum]|uniref:Uncharacterized protein n=3 Tax=Gossypium TaxID=3633 RepID=A0A5J5PRS5_GOSBA|nr:hypothetical protein ES319_D10G154800v1 [Gossypium barbadense]KAG4126161.1 hypothetical protein ERO13_D10G140300v2 [Gossypium hirsutum]TYH49900.1 hypothetical protein ES332_D10G168200v1 [Gossypium tomentosum]
MLSAIFSIDSFSDTRWEPEVLSRVLLPRRILLYFLIIPLPLLLNPFPEPEKPTGDRPMMLFEEGTLLLGFLLLWKTTAECLPESRLPTSTLTSFLSRPSIFEATRTAAALPSR